MLRILFISGFLFLASTLLAQIGNNKIREGNDDYNNGKYDVAEQKYMQSLQQNPSEKATYNLANSFYRQEKYKEAAAVYNELGKNSVDKASRSKAYHNLGNSLLKDNQLQPAIDAYKNALINNPYDEDSRYNLSLAQKLLKQQEQNQEEQNQDQNQDQEQNQDQQNQDQQEQDKNQDQQDKEQQQDQQDKQDQQKEQQQQEQQKPKDELSKEEAERMLQTLNNEEKDLLDKMKKDKAKVQKIQIEKDW